MYKTLDHSQQNQFNPKWCFTLKNYLECSWILKMFNSMWERVNLIDTSCCSPHQINLGERAWKRKGNLIHYVCVCVLVFLSTFCIDIFSILTLEWTLFISKWLYERILVLMNQWVRIKFKFSSMDPNGTKGIDY